MLGLDHFIAEARTIGNVDFQVLLLLFLVFVEEFVVRVQTRFSLGLTCFRSHAHPLEFALQCLATLGGHFLFLLHALRFLLEPRRIVAFPGNSLSAVELENPTGHVIEEVSVVRHGDNCSFVLVEVLFEPVYGFGIEVVGGLVEEQNIGLLDEQTTQGDTAAFAPGEKLASLICRRTMEGGHGTIQAAVEIPGVGGVDDVLQFALARKQLVHLVCVFVVLGESEFLVDVFVFSQRVYYVLNALLHDFANGF